MTTGEVILLIFILLLVAAAVAAVLYFVLQYRKKQRGAPDHIELYFQDHFSNIASEWDLMSRDSAKQWKNDITSRLTKVGSEIDGLKKQRNAIDARIVNLEHEVTRLEEGI